MHIAAAIIVTPPQAKRLGDEAFKAKKWAEAIEHYTTAIAENPRCANAPHAVVAL